MRARAAGGRNSAIYTLEDVFRVSIASPKHEGELGEFETVMQTRGAVEGTENSRILPLPRKNSSIAFIKYFSKIIRQMKENS